MQSARTLAKLWRANPADRLRIEREIAATGRQDEFRYHDGQLVARMTPAIREAITNSGGGAFVGTSDDRRFWAEMKKPEIVAASGIGLVEARPHGSLGFAIIDRDDLSLQVDARRAA
jgi:hypothetical protein